VIVALVYKDGAMGVELEPAEEEVPVAVAIAILVVVSVGTLPAVAVFVPVAAVCISVDSEGETAAVDEGGESATVSWLTVGASKPGEQFALLAHIFRSRSTKQGWQFGQAHSRNSCSSRRRGT
jgi:hypothetical protein